MDSRHIAELLRPYVLLDEDRLRKTSIYIDILLKWNARLNLTAIRDPEEMVTRHFGESYFAAERLLDTHAKLEVVDVGSGAGFPGVPMAIFAPGSRVALIEANVKKSAFLKEVKSALGLTNTTVFSGRAEQFSGSADLVTMRAVEKFEQSLPIILRLVRDRGRAGLMIGLAQVNLARDLGWEFKWDEPMTIPGGNSRVLLAGIREVKVG